MAKPLAILLCLTTLLLAGCSSSPGASDPTLTTQAPTVDPTLRPAPEVEPEPVVQEERLAWTVAAMPCGDSSATRSALEEAYRQDLDGVTYDSAAIDEATRGGNYSITFQASPGTVVLESLFWSGAVGPGGRVVSSGILLLLTLTTTTVMNGTVPADAEFLTKSSCGPVGSTASYLAQSLGTLLLKV